MLITDNIMRSMSDTSDMAEHKKKRQTDVDTGLTVLDDSGDEQDDEAFAEKAESVSSEVPLLSGEKVIAQALDVTYLCPFSGRINGTLYVTNYKIYMQGNDEPLFTVESPLCSIAKIEKIGASTKKTDGGYGLDILCKDMRNLRFALKQENSSRKKIYDAMQTHAFPLSSGLTFFAFDYKEEFKTNGWEIYDPIREYKRQGLPTDCWRLTSVNHSYALCDTYPSVLAVPSSVADEEVQKVASFRSRSRIPVLSWLHPTNNASITRCSQPNIGVGGIKRNKDDEKYIQAILDANPQCHKLYIMDARPKINAVANQACVMLPIFSVILEYRMVV